ncbi:hypothetical protein DSO57_1023662 [Entomophthora muscae]|uniref:Uncharacterized protein n=1 Tax=Entomophthora muscae TaxID=34485 RepID=A0ACC2RTT5_9FUNG|nr:hypothetical protein DSO57_1023662 [Entomophthora muscae]
MRYWFPQLRCIFSCHLPVNPKIVCPPASLPATYHSPGALFGPVYFTEYPLKPEYKDYTANNILAWDLLARTTERTRYSQEGPWYITKPHLFRDKYNFLPAYQMDMEPPVTPKPMPASAAKLPLDHTNKPFGIVYITLTGVIDTIVPATGLWLWVGKSISYLIKLASILWWALPTQFKTCQFPNTSKLANQGWFPDIIVPKPSRKAIKATTNRIVSTTTTDGVPLGDISVYC